MTGSIAAFCGAVLVMVGTVLFAGALSDWRGAGRGGHRGWRLLAAMACGASCAGGGLALVWLRPF